MTSFLWQPAFEANYALGHDFNGDTITKQRFHTEFAAGSMETTVGDYSRFLAAAMQGKRLSAKSKQQMFSPQIFIYTKRQFDELSAYKFNFRITMPYICPTAWAGACLQALTAKPFLKKATALAG